MNKANFSRTKLYLKNELVFLQPVEYNSYFAGACISWRRDANGGTWQPHYRITDHLGSTRLETSSNGTITAAYDYKPFGEQIPLMTSKTRKTYIGKERDDESYLGDFGVRKYDYAAGRFTSPDVLWEVCINYSPYCYGLNNPISKLDPSGLLMLNSDGSLLFTPYGSVGIGRYKTGENTIFNYFQNGYLFADDGTKIVASSNRSFDIRFDTDCAGLTFTGGKYWIGANEVKKIIAGDGYKKVDRKDVKKDDVLTYSNETGVFHTAKVYDIKENTMLNRKEIIVEELGGIQIIPDIVNEEDGWNDGWFQIDYYRKPEGR